MRTIRRIFDALKEKKATVYYYFYPLGAPGKGYKVYQRGNFRLVLPNWL